MMFCDDCGKKPATLHVTKIINDQKFEKHLCEECAAQDHQLNIGLMQNFSIPQFLSNLLNYDQVMQKSLSMQTKQNEVCPECGLSYAQFVQQGKMGCSICYETFKNHIDGLLKRIHGASIHAGKVPKRTGGKFRLQRDLLKMRQQLAEHVSKEEFEAAAKVRDEIKALEDELKI